MSPKNVRSKRNIKKILSSILCLLIALLFITSIFTYGFSIYKLVFGVLCLYFSFSFFRMSKE